MSITLNKQYNLYVPTAEPRLLDKDWFEKSIVGVKRDTAFIMNNSNHRVVVQAGGCFGIWPQHLSQYYEQVLTFEPDPILFECVIKNTDPAKVQAVQAALGDKQDQVTYYRATKNGAGTLTPNVSGRYPGQFKVNQIRLDDLELEICDAIILDIERGEVNALKGAKETIDRFRPPIQVEMHDKTREEITNYLTSIGYKHAARAGSRDEIWLA